jgi:hypothetical protein
MMTRTGYRRITLLVLTAASVLVGAKYSIADDDQPTIAKDSIRFGFTGGRSAAFEKPGWVPSIDFRINGPIASGTNVTVEFSLPGKSSWVKFNCQFPETEKGHWWHTECGGDDLPNEKAVTYTGPVGFTIKASNELTSTNLTLFTGKVKVGKNPPPPHSGANYQVTASEFFADDDWKIPIGYLFLAKDDGHMNQSFLHALFWYRGNPAEVQAHLFYNGKDIAKCNIAGNGASDYNPKKNQWGFADCEFLGVYLEPPSDNEGYDPKFGLKGNPGEYEVKALIVGHLARSIKFKVDADGKFDNGIATSNKLGSQRIIVPVQVIGNAETWDKTAWKTGAFYGNPLTGFAPSQ